MCAKENEKKIQPTLIYDGDCKFCIREAKRAQKLAGEELRIYSLRNPKLAVDFPHLHKEECEKEVKLVLSDGRVFGGAEAIVRTLATRRIFWMILWIYYIPGIRLILNWLYRKVALHRFKIRYWFQS